MVYLLLVTWIPLEILIEAKAPKVVPKNNMSYDLRTNNNLEDNKSYSKML